MNSSAIEIQSIEGKGRGYIAKRDIKLGERLLEEDPLTATYKYKIISLNLERF